MSNNVHSDSTARDEFLHGAARAYFVISYADYVEDTEREPDGITYAAANGGDWCDVAPETTPDNAFALAGELWAGLVTRNKETAPGGVYSLFINAAKADGLTEDDEIDYQEFGHYLAMQSMGHGVSWFDDHKFFPLVVPMVECSQFSFDPEAYRAD